MSEDIGTIPKSETASSKQKIPAWLISGCLHATMLAILLWVFQIVPPGAGDETIRSGGIVLVQRAEPPNEYLSEAENTESFSNSQEAVASPTSSALPDQTERPQELSGFTESIDDGVGLALTTSLNQSVPSLEQMFSSSGGGDLSGGRVTTEVFGVKGTGSTFVYVFDRSASMNGYQRRPLKAAKQELISSLKSLRSIHRFQIIFYNDRTVGFSPTSAAAPALWFADKSNKVSGERFINSIDGAGGTNHMNALKLALALRPEVVFLLTDAEGGFTSHELAQIRGWNISQASINAIEFGVGSKSNHDDQSLERLAEQNSGQYLYKNVTTLKLQQ